MAKYKYLIASVLLLLSWWRAWDIGYGEAELKYESEKKEAIEAALAVAEEQFELERKNFTARETIVYKYRDKIKEVTKYVEVTPDASCTISNPDWLRLINGAASDTDTDPAPVPDDPGQSGVRG